MLLIIVLSLALVLAALELRRRLRKKKAGSRFRVAVGGLSLERDRPAAGRKGKARTSSRLAGPVILGLVTAVLCLWLAASYLLPEGAGPAPSLEIDSLAEASPPEQTSNLAGTLSPQKTGQDAAVRAAAGQAAAPLPPSASLSAAATAVIPSASRLEQIGLMPGRNEPKAQPKPEPKSEPKTAAARPAGPEQPPKAALQTAENKAVAASSAARTPTSSSPSAPARAAAAPKDPVRAASSPSTAASAASPPAEAAAPGPLSSGGRTFTVHLSSFTEELNAENYKARLIAAGESAFVSRADVDGRLWYRVMSGRFGSRSEADSHGRDLKRRGLTENNGRFLVKPLD